MHRTCIVVVDAARARVFTFAREATPEGMNENLSERTDLVNPARRRPPHELFSDTRPGSSQIGGLQYGLDDHRDGHLDHLDQEFARDIVAEIDRALRAADCHRLVLCASSRMLGVLRPLVAALHHPDLAVDEVQRNLVKLPAPRLRHQLASYGLLPPVEPRRAWTGRP